MSRVDFSAVKFFFSPPSLIIKARNGGELWQGSFPNGDLQTAGIDLLVLAAEELQPDENAKPGYYKGTPDDLFFPGVDVILAPNKDEAYFPVSRKMIALMAAQHVADAVREGKNVLVTCAAGLNRSGLVTALALRELFGKPGEDAVARVRERRPGALTNEIFADFVIRCPYSSGSSDRSL